MEQKFIKQMEKKLLEEKAGLEKELGNIAKKKGKKFTLIYPEYGKRDEENAAEITEYDLNLALDKNLEKLLAENIKALARIKNGSYGKCDNCNKEISIARLEAFPSATFCIDCQSKNDNRITKFFSRFRKIKSLNKRK